MKKILALLLVILTLLSLTACGKSEAAKKADELISQIGEVTLEKEADIIAAEEAVSALTEEDRNSLSNLSVLETARNTYNELVDQAAIKEVEDLIAAIGEVSLDSEAAIVAAEKALKDLSPENAEKVSNKNVLSDARTQYDKAKTEAAAKAKEEAETLLKGFQKEADEFNGVTFYYPKGWDFFDDGSWDATECFVRPYLGINGQYVYIVLCYNYSGDDWVFWKNLTFLVDGNKYTKSVSYYDISRDNDGGIVWEYYDDLDPNMDMLRAMAGASEAKVRFAGNDYSYDYTLTKSDLDAIRQTLAAFDALVTSGYIPA